MPLLPSEQWNSLSPRKPSLTQSFPPELLTFILEYSSPRDIIHFQMTCRTMQDIVKGNAHIRYRIALFEACMVEGVRGDLSHDDCLRILRQREQAWHGLRWRKRAQIRLPDSNTENPFQLALGGGVLHTFGYKADGTTFFGVHTILPSSEDFAVPPQTYWQINYSDFPVKHIYPDCSQDLLVLFEHVPHHWTYKLHFRTLSTNDPHPHASHPLLLGVGSNNPSADDLQVRVAGDYIGVLLLAYVTDSGIRETVFHLWNWRAGIKIRVPPVSKTVLKSFVFLTDHTILFCAVSVGSDPRVDDNPPVLQLYEFSGECSQSGGSVQHKMSYYLPTLHHSASLVNITMFSQGSASWSAHTGAVQRQMYSSDPNQSIIAMHLRLRSRLSRRSSAYPVSGEWYTLIVKTAALISDAYRRSSSGPPAMVTVVPWDDWGVEMTRMLPETSLCPHAVSGARCAKLFRRPDGLFPLIVYDFNTRRRPIQLNDDSARPHEGDVVTVFGESVVRSRLFAHPVRTSLPYHMVSTGPMFDWTAIEMDEERIIGGKHEFDGDIMTVHPEVLVM